MPIGGFVIHVHPDLLESMNSCLREMHDVTVLGNDGQAAIAVVIDSPSTEKMEKLVKEINAFKAVLSIGVTYLNVEDEAETLMSGDSITGIFHGERLESIPG